MNRYRIFRALIVGLALASIGQPCLAQSDSDNVGVELQSEAEQQAQTVRRLLAIKLALEDRRARVRELLEQIASADEVDKPRLLEQVAEHRERIRDLTASFENIAVGGATLREVDEVEERQLAWHEELTQIARPILNSLREATEKPRRIAELRTEMSLYEQQLETARRALSSIGRFEQQGVPPEVAEGLESVAASWNERKQDIERSQEIARNELRSLETGEGEVFDAIRKVVSEFLLGSGLTLLLAVVAGLVVWFVMRALRRVVKMWRRSAENPEYAARIRVLLYSYHLLTIVLVAFVVLAVFYVRGDLLLLSLAIITLAMLVLGVWRFLPGYVREARLLLNVGPAREGERVIYNGLPMRITSLNFFSELRNPELEGVIRLPLSALAQLISRPRIDEIWFPSREGDYLLLPDGSFGQVLKQTVEMVQLKVMGSILQYSSADFLQLGARNLSREGFGIAVVFGIDYQHQDISLDVVPQRLYADVESAFDEAGFGENLQSLVVEFKEAAASSLNYIVYATLDGDSASSYFKLGRLIQQACVDTCNREGWVIPFTQVTIHQADEVSGPDADEQVQPA